MNNKVFLCILDGFALGDENYEYNAVFKATMPNLRRFLKTYPYTLLSTSGTSVGLPKGQMGNSEVGHMTIGSGRILKQDLPKIFDEIESGEIWRKQAIINALKDLKQSGGRLHLLGLCSFGGVHSHILHIIEIANFFAKNGVEVCLHAISNGRDVGVNSFVQDLKEMEKLLEKKVKIVSLCGRFYAMDRDGKQERTQQAVNLVLEGKGRKYEGIEGLSSYILSSYEQNITDEFIEPLVSMQYNGVGKEDILFFANFRADRARQIVQNFVEADAFAKIITLMEVKEDLTSKTEVLFFKPNLTNTLGEVIANAGLLQLRVAETEKYAHVTFFFNGGKEPPLKGEERILVPSPKVTTYDLQPEMSLPQVEESLLKAFAGQSFSFICCNVANGDMVGHTGNFDAAKKAAERIDEFLGKCEKACLANGYTMLVTADHGNLEEMKMESGQIHTQHTTGKVPFFIISSLKYSVQKKDASLANIAPTVLKMLNLPIAKEMEEPLI